jgi:FKBP-type peptidyl-prolyl cis-trans isomerase
MFKNLKFILAAAFAGLFLFSCAEESEESNASIQKRILDAYLDVNYPNKDYTITNSGLVILNHQEGEGTSPDKYGAAYVKYSAKNLSGDYQSTMFEDVARRIGTYSPDIYYGPQLSTFDYGEITEGLNEAMKMMKKGSKMTVIIPPSLSKYDGENTGGYGYATEKSESSSVNSIYEIEMYDVVTNLQKYQLDSIQKFRDINYPGLDSTMNMFYFKKLSGTRTDTIPLNETAKVWYVGRLLDGYIFDTNIRDTAKKYGLWSESKTYDPLEVTYESSYTGMASSAGTMNVSGVTGGSSNNDDGESGSYVPGFAKALKSMTYGDHAITFFGSGWGYGSKGSMSSGSGVPTYSMLFFEIFVEEEDK